jgi:hypothetical protein
MSDIADNPEALAAYVRHLGGTPIAHRTFRFEMPLSETKRVIPQIAKLNLRCEKVGERTDNDTNGKTCSIATIEISRRPTEKTDYQAERDLMAAIIR